MRHSRSPRAAPLRRIRDSPSLCSKPEKPVIAPEALSPSCQTATTATEAGPPKRDERPRRILAASTPSLRRRPQLPKVVHNVCGQVELLRHPYCARQIAGSPPRIGDPASGPPAPHHRGRAPGAPSREPAIRTDPVDDPTHPPLGTAPQATRPSLGASTLNLAGGIPRKKFIVLV